MAVPEDDEGITPSLQQLIGHFVDPSPDASPSLPPRRRSAGRADDLVAHLDRQRAGWL
jgi:hypothetical protein